MLFEILVNQNVADLLSRWPEVIPLFLTRRMSCVGCTMSRFETLAEVSGIYGLDLALFLAEINRTIGTHSNGC
jgi:hybrid cluster-associated redox disulfide protein